MTTPVSLISPLLAQRVPSSRAEEAEEDVAPPFTLRGPDPRILLLATEKDPRVRPGGGEFIGRRHLERMTGSGLGRCARADPAIEPAFAVDRAYCSQLPMPT